VPAKIQSDNYNTPFSNVVMVAARDWHNIAVKSDGSVWQWGANDQGQCGDNATIDRWRPVKVSGLGPRVGLALSAAPSAPGYVDLRWQSATGEYFSVEYTTSLKDGFTTVMQSNVLATPPTNSVTVPIGNDRAFYRLKF
jgi:alpha-tubulin suppressor-like RCC1 family protein